MEKNGMHRRLHQLVLTCLAFAAAAALLAACGGGSSTESTADTSAETTGGSSTEASSGEFGIGLKLGKPISEAEVGLAEGPFLAWDAEACEYKEVPEPAAGYPAAVLREVAGEPQIGYMHYGDTDPFGVANSKSIEDLAAKAGFKLNLYNLKYPSETEPLSQAKIAVTKQDLGVIQAQQVPSVSPAFLKILQEEGCIPSVQMYLKTENVPSMGADWEEVGRTQGEWLAEYATTNDFDPQKTALVECTDREVGESVNVMFQAAPEAIREAGFELPEENVFELTCPYQKAEQAMTDWFTANPDFEHVMMNTIDDERMQFMTNAARKSGASDKIATIAAGADDLGRTQIRSGAEMASVAFFPERYGEWLVPLLQDVLAGNPVPSFTGSELVVITDQNIDQYYEK